MDNKHKIVKRGIITYYLSENSILVSVNNRQFISYNVYNSPARSGIAEFKKKILASKEGQFHNALEQMDLARKCNLIGSSTRRPDWLVAE